MNETFVTVVGNVVADPVTRPTKQGRPFASLRVASTTRRWDTETRTFVDGATNFVNVAAFNALAANVMASVRRGHPVVVHGRLRVNQWQTDKGEPRTSVEVDAYSIGHDLSRGQTLFTKPDRIQLDTNDRLADPAIQESFDPQGADGEESTEPAEAERYGQLASGSEPSTAGRGFDRTEQDAETDEYVTVSVG